MIIRKGLMTVAAFLLLLAVDVSALTVDAGSRSSVWQSHEYTPDRVVVEPYPVAADALCGQWWQILQHTGFADADIVKADAIMFRESRCDPSQINSADPVTIGKHKGSFGLFQINLFWLKRTRWYPDGFLQTKLGRSLSPLDLLSPEVNIEAALTIIEYGRVSGGCGWQAWNGC